MEKQIRAIVCTLSLPLAAGGFFACSDSDSDHGGRIALELDNPIVPPSSVSQFMKVTCNGSWTISFEYPEGQAEWCSTFTPSGSGSRRVALSYSVNSLDESRSVLIRLKSGNRQADVTFTQRGKDEPVEPGRMPHTGWRELPAMQERPDFLYVEHASTVTAGQTPRAVRNYSFFFDKIERIAYWVAYPLSDLYLGSTGRTDAFKPDPSFSSFYQMTSTIGGYDRGHQLPSGDRTNNKPLNEQTFYYSNMTPQLGSFNQKIWVDMEGKVRAYAKSCDTLYVVTGAVLRTVGGNETVKHVSDKNGHSIAVPNYYYKVLLQLNPKAASGQDYIAIGFWFRHEPNTGVVTSAYTRSVREIEALTGFDYFANLPKEVQDQVETQRNPGLWGL